VELKGHEKEVGGVDWAGGDLLASCSDDFLVRFWRPDIDISRKAREDKETRWKWSGSD